MNYPTLTTLKTERTVIRPFRKDDSRKLFENYGSDESVRRYINFFLCDTLKGCEDFVDMHLSKYDFDYDFYGWCVEIDGEPVGSAGIYNLDKENEIVEVGYSIGSRWWNRGYMTEVLGALIDFAFEKMAANRLVASCHTENVGSARIMEKNGMKKEGLMRQAQKNPDGSYSDLYLYSILKEEHI